MTHESDKVPPTAHMSRDKTPLTALLPSLITLLGLCFGLFSLKLAVDGRWEHAVLCLVVAAFIDGIDGRVARLLNASSKFGAELDSLADFLNFAVAPALISYMWMTKEVRGAGWAVCMFFVICGAIRLARFNAAANEGLTTEAPEENGAVLPRAGIFPLKMFRSRFCGIPAPAGGLLCLMPMMMMFFQYENFETPLFRITPPYYMVYIAVIGALMMSRLPTISLKGMKIPQKLVPPVLAAFGGAMVMIIVEPWAALPVIGIGYLLLIPFTYMFGGDTRKEYGE